MNSLIETLTKMSIETQNKNLRLLARVDESTKIKMLEPQPSIFHKLRSKNTEVDKTILNLASLILAIDEVTNELDELSMSAATDSANYAHKSPQRSKLLGYWAIVRSLRYEKGYSLRKIQLHLKKKRKFDVSYSTIHNLWHELEINDKNKEK